VVICRALSEPRVGASVAQSAGSLNADADNAGTWPVCAEPAGWGTVARAADAETGRAMSVAEDVEPRIAAAVGYLA
jgi:hypothetical protein